MCEIVSLNVCVFYYPLPCTEAEFKEKHGVWDPMPESTPTRLPWATLCQSRPSPYARLDFIPQSGTLDLASVYTYSMYNVSCTV